MAGFSFRIDRGGHAPVSIKDEPGVVGRARPPAPRCRLPLPLPGRCRRPATSSASPRHARSAPGRHDGARDSRRPAVGHPLKAALAPDPIGPARDRVGPGASVPVPIGWDGPAQATTPCGRSCPVRSVRAYRQSSVEGLPRIVAPVDLVPLPPAGSPTSSNRSRTRSRLRAQRGFTDRQGMDVMKLKSAIVALGALAVASWRAGAGRGTSAAAPASRTRRALDDFNAALGRRHQGRRRAGADPGARRRSRCPKGSATICAPTSAGPERQRRLVLGERQSVRRRSRRLRVGDRPVPFGFGPAVRAGDAPAPTTCSSAPSASAPTSRRASAATSRSTSGASRASTHTTAYSYTSTSAGNRRRHR